MDKFFQTLEACHGQFEWYIDADGWVRARHPRLPGRFCPVTAVYYATTGRATEETSRAFDADVYGPCGLDDHDAAVVNSAADNDLDDPSVAPDELHLVAQTRGRIIGIVHPQVRARP